MGKPKRDQSRPSNGVDRREFIKSAAAAAVALSIPTGPFHILSRTARGSGPTDDPRIVVVRDSASNSGTQIQSSVTRVMMDEAIRQYTGMTDIGEAYQSVFPGISEESVIGIKVNCINSSLSTHPEVVNGLVNGLLEMQFGGTPFPMNNIIIWERSTWELQNAGYTINTGATGVRCFSNQYSGYSNQTINVNGSNQHPSRIMTDYCDYLVSFAVLKNHSFGGVTFTMKNHYGSIQSPGSLHGGYCDPYVPALNQQIRDVLPIQETLFIVDGIFGCYYGGPGGSPNMNYKGIILGEDRVAVDAYCRDILADAGCPTLGMSGHVDTAAEPPYNLGTANLSQVDVVEVDDPSSAVDTVSVVHSDPDVILNWTTPEYTGLFKVQRSLDPQFASFEELGTTFETTYTDAGVLGLTEKYFYRVVKTW